MFELSNVVRFVSLLTYLGFIIGSVSGFVEISKQFNLCQMFVCIIVLVFNLAALFLQLTNYINNIIKNEKNILYISSFFMLICSLLILGLIKYWCNFWCLGNPYVHVNFSICRFLE